MIHARFISILLEVFKSIKETNPLYIQNLLSVKDSGYALRDSSRLVQHDTKSTNYGLRTFSYLASKLWNDLPAVYKDITNIENPDAFKSLLKDWDGPDYLSYPLSSFYV